MLDKCGPRAELGFILKIILLQDFAIAGATFRVEIIFRYKLSCRLEVAKVMRIGVDAALCLR
jgi:hypothetical protein